MRHYMEIVLAYIDPGSDSLVIQAVVAGLVALPIVFRNQVRRLIAAVRGDGLELPRFGGR